MPTGQPAIGVKHLASQSMSMPSTPSPDISRVACCDRGYDRPSGCPRVSDPATYCSSTPRIPLPAVAQWPSHLHGLATAIHETFGLIEISITLGNRQKKGRVIAFSAFVVENKFWVYDLNNGAMQKILCQSCPNSKLFRESLVT